MYISRILCRPLLRSDIDVISVGVVVLRGNKCEFLISGNKLRLLKSFLTIKKLDTFESLLDTYKSNRKNIDLERMDDLSNDNTSLLGFSKPKYYNTDHISLSDNYVISDLFENWVEYNRDIDVDSNKKYDIKHTTDLKLYSKNRVLEVLTENSDNWAFNHKYAFYKPNKIGFWIGGGILGFKPFKKSSGLFLWGWGVSLGIINTIKLYYWLKNINRKQIINTK